MLSQFLGWLPSLSVVNGTARWRIDPAAQAPVDLTVDYSASDVAFEFSHPDQGKVSVGGGQLTYTPSSGTPLSQRLPANLGLSGLRQGLSPDAGDFIRLVRRAASPEIAEALDWLKGLRGDVTILVIPGISAFGIETPPLRLGNISLPSMTADISLRNVAIDLHGGHVACELRIHRARAAQGDGVTISLEQNELHILEPQFWLAADFVASIGGKTIALTVDSADFSARTMSAMATLADGSSVAMETSNVDVRCRAFSLDIDLKSDTTTLLRAEATATAKQALLEFSGLTMGPVRAPLFKTSSAADNLTLTLSATSHGITGSVEVERLSLTADLPEIVALPFNGEVVIDPATPLAIEGRFLGIDLASSRIIRGVIDADVEVSSAELYLSGLTIQLAKGLKLRGEVAYTGVDMRSGLTVRFPEAILGSNSPGTPGIQLFNGHAGYWREDIAAVWGAPKPVLQHRALAELGITVHIDPFTFLSERNIYIPLDNLTTTLVMLDVMGQLVPEIQQTIEPVLGPIRDFFDYAKVLSQVSGVLGFFVRIEAVELVVKLKKMTIEIDNDLSNDNKLVFAVKTGLRGLGLRVTYSWPDPKWDDWDNRDSDTKDLLDVDFDVDFPDIMIETTLTYDTAAERIMFTDVTLWLRIGSGKVQEITHTIQSLLLNGYGIQGYLDGIIQALNVRVPTGLPPSWDVSDLRIEKSDGVVDGITINLRANEVVFASP